MTTFNCLIQSTRSTQMTVAYNGVYLAHERSEQSGEVDSEHQVACDHSVAGVEQPYALQSDGALEREHCAEENEHKAVGHCVSTSSVVVGIAVYHGPSKNDLSMTPQSEKYT